MQLSLKSNILFVFFFILFVFVNCDLSNDYNPHILKPKAKKDYGEILFGLNKKYWNHELGKTIKISFENLIKSTPLPFEKEYTVDFMVPKKIIKNIKRKSCIVFIEIENYHSKKTVPIFKKDLWATNQLIVELKFKTEKLAVEYFKINTNLIKEKINQFYYLAILKKYSKINSINKSIKNELPLKYITSKEMKINKKGEDFWWFSELNIKKDQNGSHEIQKGILIYKYPYYSPKQFKKQNQINIRDSICKKYLRGKKNISYMITVKNGLNETNSNPYLLNNNYFTKLSGCWKMKNDKMGGAFVSLCFLTPDKKYIITTEGYVYAPNFEKIKLIRELESILYSPFLSKF